MGRSSTPRDTRLWHPFGAMGQVRSSELVVTRADDVWIWDDAGNRYLDATASLWYMNAGHGRREIVDAVRDQLSELEAFSTFNDFANRPAIDLAARLADLSPMSDARVFLTSGGGDSIDTAAKLARRYWSLVGEPQRTTIMYRDRAYHGTHGFGTSLAGLAPNREGFGPLHPGTAPISRSSVDEVRRAIEREDPAKVAAVFVEPVIGAGGVHPPPDGYLEGVAAICREIGALLVLDEVICAFGRLGHWFSAARWGLAPDLITFAKGVSSGYLPIGGVIASGRVAEPFWDGPDDVVFRHGATFSGHPACCAAALANLDVLEREGLVPRGAQLERALLDALAPLSARDSVAEVRGGVGLLAAVELAPELLARLPDGTVGFAREVRKRGVIVRPLGTAVAVSPPLTATREHLELAATAIDAALVDADVEIAGAGR